MTYLVKYNLIHVSYRLLTSRFTGYTDKVLFEWYRSEGSIKEE